MQRNGAQQSWEGEGFIEKIIESTQVTSVEGDPGESEKLASLKCHQPVWLCSTMVS